MGTCRGRADARPSRPPHRALVRRVWYWDDPPLHAGHNGKGGSTNATPTNTGNVIFSCCMIRITCHCVYCMDSHCRSSAMCIGHLSDVTLPQRSRLDADYTPHSILPTSLHVVLVYTVLARKVIWRILQHYVSNVCRDMIRVEASWGVKD